MLFQHRFPSNEQLHSLQSIQTRAGSPSNSLALAHTKRPYHTLNQIFLMGKHHVLFTTNGCWVEFVIQLFCSLHFEFLTLAGKIPFRLKTLLKLSGFYHFDSILQSRNQLRQNESHLDLLLFIFLFSLTQDCMFPTPSNPD